jgi:hypothetical protein
VEVIKMAGISELYLKITYKSKDNSATAVNLGKLNWKLEIGEKKHRVCGGMYSRNSGTVIFKVSDIEEAVDVVKKAYIAGSDTYRYEINYKLLAV